MKLRKYVLIEHINIYVEEQILNTKSLPNNCKITISDSVWLWHLSLNYILETYGDLL